MRNKHARTLSLIFHRPASGNVKWMEVEALFKEPGATITQAEGSRVAVVLLGEVRTCSTARIRVRTSTKARSPASANGWSLSE